VGSTIVVKSCIDTDYSIFIRVLRYTYSAGLRMPQIVLFLNIYLKAFAMIMIFYS